MSAERVQPAPIYLRYIRIPFQINCRASAERVQPAPIYLRYISVNCCCYRVSLKKILLWFSSYFSSRGWILLFHIFWGIRIASPIHLATHKVPIQSLNCYRNAGADTIFIPAFRLELHIWSRRKQRRLEMWVCSDMWQYISLQGSLNSKWVSYKWLDELWSTFWFQNSCEKVISNF